MISLTISSAIRRLLLCTVVELTAGLSSDVIADGFLKVSENSRFLVQEDGQPFFWIGDTAWELFHRLGKADAEVYLETRAQQGFNVVQCVAIGYEKSLTVPTPDGHLPLIDLDPAKPNEAYFQHVDWIVDRAAELGIYLAILPSWGAHVRDLNNAESDNHPVFSESNAQTYGNFLGRRYRDRWNIIWVLGGDRIPVGYEKIWKAMAAGLESGDGGKHLMTYHVNGEHSSSEYWHKAPWLDFNMLQSGHPLGVFSNNYDYVHADYEKVPAKPTLDGEALYEGMPIGFVPTNGRATAHHIRANAYCAVFAGAFGHTYGHNSVIQMCPSKSKCGWWAEISWRDALVAKGAVQMKHLKNLMLSRPFLSRIPDQGALKPQPLPNAVHPQLTRDGTLGKSDATYLMVYYPYVTWTNKINTRVIASDTLRAWWYDPRTGKSTPLGISKNTGVWDLEWNTRLDASSGGPDWILVIDAAGSNYPPPGTLKKRP